MIIYLSTQRFSSPARHLAQSLPVDLRNRFRHLSYEELLFERAAPIAHYIFTDYDRLSRFEIECVASFVAALRSVAPEAKVLNDPVRVLERTSLLAALYRNGINDFAVTRLDTGARPERYPVFIRAEDGYAGPETNVLHNAAELEEALADFARRGLPLKGRIAVGYAAEPGPDGLYRKYGAFNVGGNIYPHHLHRSRHWIVKRNSALFDGSDSSTDELQWTPESLAEELEFVRSCPHTEQLSRIFRIAGIDFGRIDYGVVGGRIQVYEINTNPNAPRSKYLAAIAERRAITREHLFSALRGIDTSINVSGRVKFRVSRPLVHDLPIPRMRLPASIMRRLADRIRPPHDPNPPISARR